MSSIEFWQTAKVCRIDFHKWKINDLVPVFLGVLLHECRHRRERLARPHATTPAPDWLARVLVPIYGGVGRRFLFLTRGAHITIVRVIGNVVVAPYATLPTPPILVSGLNIVIVVACRVSHTSFIHGFSNPSKRPDPIASALLWGLGRPCSICSDDNTYSTFPLHGRLR